MQIHMPQDVTQLLVEWGGGNEQALDRLLPLVYDELKKRANAQMRRERDGHTLDSTGLVHEVYLRLVDQKQGTWQNRAQFFGLASKMIRGILVDHARARNAAKRGGGALQLSSTNAIEKVAAEEGVDLL